MFGILDSVCSVSQIVDTWTQLTQFLLIGDFDRRSDLCWLNDKGILKTDTK